MVVVVQSASADRHRDDEGHFWVRAMKDILRVFVLKRIK